MEENMNLMDVAAQEADTMINEEVIGEESGTRDLAIVVGVAALAGAGALALAQKTVIPVAKKGFGWIKSKLPHRKHHTDVNDVPQAEESDKTETEE